AQQIGFDAVDGKHLRVSRTAGVALAAPASDLDLHAAAVAVGDVGDDDAEGLADLVGDLADAGPAAQSSFDISGVGGGGQVDVVEPAGGVCAGPSHDGVTHRPAHDGELGDAGGEQRIAQRHDGGVIQ